MSRLSKFLPLDFLSDASATENVWLATVDQAAKYTVGRIYTAEDGKAYVYLKGVASVAIGSVVTFIVTTPLLSTTKLAAVSLVGHVGVAMSAAVAGDFGWFQIAGLNLVTKADSSAAIGQAYIGGTSGNIDSTDVPGDALYGMQITVAESGGVAGVFMTYPTATNVSNL